MGRKQRVGFFYVINSILFIKTVEINLVVRIECHIPGFFYIQSQLFV
jgi:hypothetical protein